jgi:hypothetical protein
MKRKGVMVILALILVFSLVASASAWSYSQHKNIRTQKVWNPWMSASQMSAAQVGVSPMGVSPMGVSQMGVSFPGYGMQGMYMPMRYGGMFAGQCWDPYMCGYAFYANETQIAEVSGIWETDLLGKMNIMLTGDDTIRGTYEVDDIKGYLEGNFTSNETQGMDGIWWEEPSYQPPMSAGIISMTFVNESYLEGTFSYPDGMWGPFTGVKTNPELSSEIQEDLKNMPEVNWTVNLEEKKVYRVTNEAEKNPVMSEGEEK